MVYYTFAVRVINLVYRNMIDIIQYSTHRFLIGFTTLREHLQFKLETHISFCFFGGLTCSFIQPKEKQKKNTGGMSF
jgi:hypothetical protein